MKQVEKTGRTVEEALELALIEMDLTADQVTYEVLEKESKGLFGFGAREAKILVTEIEGVSHETVTVPEITPELYELEDSLLIEREKKSKDKPKDKPKDKSLDTPKTKSEPAVVKQDKAEVKEPAPAPPGESAALVEQYVQSIVKGIGVEALVEATETEDMVEATIQGEGMALIIGKRGSTIDALQYLASLALNRGQNQYMHVSLDSENYRQKRQQALESLAKRMADKAKRQRKDIMLNPMNSYERRIIHTSLQKDPLVSTRSEGKDPYRKVIIFLNR